MGLTCSRIPGIPMAACTCKKPRTQLSGTSTLRSNRPPAPEVVTSNPSGPIRNWVRRLVRISPNAPHSQAVKSIFVVPVTTSPSVSKIAGSTIKAAYTEQS